MRYSIRMPHVLGWGVGLLLLVAAGAQALTWQLAVVDRGSAT